MNEKMLGPEWYSLLNEECRKEYIQTLKQKLKEEYSTGCYPKVEDIFNAYKLAPPEKLKVVIIGQDPYHNGHAHGLAFSSTHTTTPASLRTIFKVIDRSILKSKGLEEHKANFPTNDLTCWAKQGVFLLNPVLTVKPGVAGSHEYLGWQEFTGNTLRSLNRLGTPVVYLLWGKKAQQFFLNLDMDICNRSMVLMTGHPATASYGKDQFTGCDHFLKTNEFLVKQGLSPIQWNTKNS